MARVLLLEDLPAFGDQFCGVFGVENVTLCSSVNDLRAALSAGHDWDYAFVDFSLGEVGAETGLTALALLADKRPRTRRVGFTALGSPSRPMFAVAAHRWFGVWGLMDKSDATSRALREVGAGRNPTGEGWLRRLRTDGHLIDRLFAEPSWGPLWVALQRANGTPEGLSRIVPGMSKATVRRSFILKVEPEVRNFAAAFIGRLKLAEKPQPMLIDFWRENAAFFEAPDLLATLDGVEPWRRVRPYR